MVEPLGIDRYRNVVVLTGAGVSVASGLRPYRGPGGLWGEVDVASVATARALAERPADVWRHIDVVRRAARDAQPNAAHASLAEAQARVREGASFTLVTQNIDGLHRRAGSRDVVELHGSAFRARCVRDECDLAPFDDPEPTDGLPRACARCGAALRPDVVLFDEAIPVEAEWRVRRSLRDCDLFVAVGTSGTVSPASNFVRSARYAGARTVLVNLEPMDPPNPAYDEEHLGRAEQLLPMLLRR